MPAPIVLVHDDTEFADALIDRFSPGIRWFTDPVQALTALEIARSITFLITRSNSMTGNRLDSRWHDWREQRGRQVRVVFTGPPEHRQHAPWGSASSSRSRCGRSTWP